MLYEKAKWIWPNAAPQPNEYAYFEEGFDFSGGQAVLKLAADTDYIAWVNGQRVGFGQYAGYPFEKYFDELDITPWCVAGANTLAITVRYEGCKSLTHIDDGAGLIFTVEIDDVPVCFSGAHTKCGYDNRYVQHDLRRITSQLGRASDMRAGSCEITGTAVTLERTRNIRKRPVEKTEILEPVEAVLIDPEKRIYDLGRETAGYLYLKVNSPKAAKFSVAYGEHLADGQVRHEIGHRKFWLEFHTAPGENEFCQLFIRLAGRYLQILDGEDVTVEAIGLLPTRYPLTEKDTHLEGLDKQIYDTCVRTLRLCMNTHYEDCPWREQALYVLDSRNQMLCGYYAFEETVFARESLILMAKGLRKEGLLELTYPAVDTPAIPFFSVMYPVAVYEYVQHTGDRSILEHTMGTMQTIMQTIAAQIADNGLIREFDSPFWNFYEWTEGSDGAGTLRNDAPRPEKYHLIMNCAYLYSGKRFAELCEMAGVTFKLNEAAMKKAIEDTFFNEQTGLFCLSTLDPDMSSQLGNAMALLVGLGDGRTAEAIKNDGNLVPATLSMLGYVYDALLEQDPANREFILADIRRNYSHMLSCGATSFWETIEGVEYGSGAGSLCHGWSAMPIYYYNILNV